MHSGNHNTHIHTHGSMKPELTKTLFWVFLLNASFTVIEFVGGYLSNSIAILTDAVHDLGDTLAIASALFLEKLSNKKRNSKYSYGYRRFSLLSALITTLILILGSVYMISHSLPRIFTPQNVHAEGMFWLAILGIMVNGAAVFILRNPGTSFNQRAVMLHLMEDVLGWIAVLVGSILIYFYAWYSIDAWLSLGISLYIIFNALKNFIQLSRVFMQGVPPEIDLKTLEDKLRSIDGVEYIFDLHVWTLDGENHILSVHLAVNPNLSLEKRRSLKQSAQLLISEQNIHHSTIEFDETKNLSALKNIYETE